jgi:hypothetical protein
MGYMRTEFTRNLNENNIKQSKEKKNECKQSNGTWKTRARS